MKKILLALACMLCLAMSAQAEPKCYRELADHFFDDDKAVMQALSLHRVTQSSWTPIVHALQRSSRSVFPLARQRARAIAPNPLEPFQPAAAEKLLLDALFDVFQGVMSSFLVTNPDGNRDMVDYIRRQQPRWQECFSPATSQ